MTVCQYSIIIHSAYSMAATSSKTILEEEIAKLIAENAKLKEQCKNQESKLDVVNIVNKRYILATSLINTIKKNYLAKNDIDLNIYGSFVSAMVMMSVGKIPPSSIINSDIDIKIIENYNRKSSVTYKSKQIKIIIDAFTKFGSDIYSTKFVESITGNKNVARKFGDYFLEDIKIINNETKKDYDREGVDDFVIITLSFTSPKDNVNVDIVYGITDDKTDFNIKSYYINKNGIQCNIVNTFVISNGICHIHDIVVESHHDYYDSVADLLDGYAKYNINITETNYEHVLSTFYKRCEKLNKLEIKNIYGCLPVLYDDKYKILCECKHTCNEECAKSINKCKLMYKVCDKIDARRFAEYCTVCNQIYNIEKTVIEKKIVEQKSERTEYDSILDIFISDNSK